MPVYRRGDRWYVDIHIGGKRIRRSCGRHANRDDARAVEREIFRRHSQGKLDLTPAPPLEDAISRWFAGEAAGLRGLKELRAHARTLHPFIRDRLVSQAPAAAQDAIQAWSGRLKPATINRRLEILQRVSRLAYESWSWIQAPVHQRIKKLPERNQRHVYLQPDEVEKLANACRDPEVASLIRVAAWTGLRKGELLRVKSEDMQDGILRVGETKSGKPRVVPVPEHIQPIVARMPLNCTYSQIRDRFLEARTAAGLEHVRWHDLRHTYASWLVQGGASLRAVQELLGHSTMAVTGRYSHLDTRHLLDAVRHISDTRGRESG